MFFVPSIAVFFVIFLGLLTFFAVLLVFWFLFMVARLAILPFAIVCRKVIYGR